MKIAVINGSPRGQYSITVQTPRFLEIQHPEHEFCYLDAARTIKTLEKDFSKVADLIKWAELVLFCYPVYTFIAPSQLHRFIELLKEKGISLKGKFTAQISTSKHFYDIAASEYIRLNCLDLGSDYLDSLCADMDDLLTEKGQNDALDFFDNIIFLAKNHVSDHLPVSQATTTIPFTGIENCEDLLTSHAEGHECVVVTDCTNEESSLGKMVAAFTQIYKYEVKVINLNDFHFKGGCLGCFKCATNGDCFYTDRFDEFLRTKIQTASSIVYAFTIKDHCMGSLFKMYDDRQFCNGHRPVTEGMPIGYLVSGSLSLEPNLRLIIKGRSQVGGNYLPYIVSDEFSPALVTDQIKSMAKKMEYAVEKEYAPPRNFLGVGGMKIFRDLIYLMGGMMKADYQFYRKHNLFDFPQKQKATKFKMKMVGLLLSNPKITDKMGNKMNEAIAQPYQKVLDKAKEEVNCQNQTSS